MADTPESPPLTGKHKPANAARFPERPLDLDVRSSAGPYPRPRPPRGSLNKTWLLAAGAAVILLLTWVLFSSNEEPAPPTPPDAASLDPASASLTDSADRPTEGNLVFAPVSSQPEDKPESPQETANDKPAQPAAATEPEGKPAQATSAEPENKPATSATPAPAASAKPAAKPVQATTSDKPPQVTASAKPTAQPPAQPAEPAASIPPAAKPTEAAEQPAAASPAEKPVEISDKWVVNIYSTQDAAESLRFLSTLVGQDVGGRVYAAEANLEGRIQHRIRVGFFDTREEAEAVGLRIKEQYNLYSTPWAVRPSKEEESKYGGGR
jgi:outer membrane biosynthesis protein TonB